MNSYQHVPLFAQGRDKTNYRQLQGFLVETVREGKRDVVRIPPQALSRLAEEAFHDLAYYFRTRHLEQWSAIMADPESSDNDRFVARTLLRNAVVAAEGILPSCQDTGTATVIASKGENVFTGVNDTRQLSLGIRKAYKSNPLRNSQLAPLGMLEECNTGDNLPAQIDISACSGEAYEFLFLAKGGGSSNKTALFQENKALLGSDQQLLDFLREKIRNIGVAACPPYHLAIVIGGCSPDQNLKTVKLAAAGYYDELTTAATGGPHAYRDLEWEQKVLEATRGLGFGAQFGGRHFALDVRVIRMPRHAGSLPIGIGVSCSAHRNIRAKINRNGVFLEKLDRNPARFLAGDTGASAGVPLNLDRPIGEVVAELASLPVGTALRLSGTLVVARDAAHIRLKQQLDTTGKLPDYFHQHPIYYAGPARTPTGMPSGSFGPTTAQRMDGYVAEFMSHGASRVMLAKGNRHPSVAAACRAHNGIYLGTVGGSAAIVARDHITSSEIIDFEDLKMEAVRRIQVRDLPAFILVDNQGRSLYDACTACPVGQV